MAALKNLYSDNSRCTLSAVQPLMIFASSKYYIKSVMKDGIAQFYRFKVSKEMINNVQIVPDGSLDILFSVNGPKPKAVCYGSPLNLTDISYVPLVEESDEIFGVRFMPGNIMMPGGYQVSEFTNTGVELESLLHKDDDLIKRINDCSDFYEQTRIFTTYYLEQYRDKVISAKENNLSSFLVNEILKNRGNIKIEELSEELGYSTRYINKLFNETFGMSPKMFCKIIRFQSILRAIAGKEKIIDIADMLGFFDQSHLGREFKKFAGTSPKKFGEIINTDEYIKRLCVIK